MAPPVFAGQKLNGPILWAWPVSPSPALSLAAGGRKQRYAKIATVDETAKQPDSLLSSPTVIYPHALFSETDYSWGFHILQILI